MRPLKLALILGALVTTLHGCIVVPGGHRHDGYYHYHDPYRYHYWR